MRMRELRCMYTTRHNTCKITWVDLEATWNSYSPRTSPRPLHSHAREYLVCGLTTHCVFLYIL